MKVVIDIDDRVYGLLKYFERALGLNDKKGDNDDVKTALMRAAIIGVPLPKGHGRLVDVDELIASEKPKGISDDLWEESHIYKVLSNAPTIIEPDK